MLLAFCKFITYNLGQALSCPFVSSKIHDLSGVIALSAGQFHLLAKLWYWVYHNEIKVRTEVKQLQLQTAELAGKKPLAEN